MSTQLIQINTQAGKPVMAGDTKITPFSQSVRLMIPGQLIGFIYNRPVSLLATSPDGQEQVIPIPDVTRRVQFSLLGIAFAWVMLLITLKFILKRRK